jgi:hypothetical protein
MFGGSVLGMGLPQKSRPPPWAIRTSEPNAGELRDGRYPSESDRLVGVPAATNSA